jgi:hypothetical protein
VRLLGVDETQGALRALVRWFAEHAAGGASHEIRPGRMKLDRVMPGPRS